MNLSFLSSFRLNARFCRNFAYHKRKFILKAMILLLVFVDTSAILFAQCNHDAQRKNISVSAKNAPYIKFTEAQITPGYWYGITYEHTCYIRYQIAEFKNNGKKIYLENWCYQQNRNDRSPEELNNESRTETFTVNTNDKIGFFREFFWETKNGKNKFDYFAIDNLSWSVELIDATTQEILCVLDAISIEKSYSPSVPIIANSRPLGATAEYNVPEKFAGKSVFIRVNPSVIGESGIPLTRSDLLCSALSELYYNPNYFQNLKNAQAQKEVASVSFSENVNTEGLSVSPNPSSGEVSLSLKNVDNNSQLKYSIYNSAGQLIDIIPTEQNKYMFAQDGIYFVAATVNGKNISNQKVVISKK